MDLPPNSNAEVDSLLAQQKKKRTRLIVLFGGIGLAVVTVIGVSSVVFGRQARKKGDLAYSRATKCLVGKQLAAGEDPMLVYRAAWRGRILDTSDDAGQAAKPGKKAAALRNLEASEEASTRMWPNRCVAELVALTDTLKEIGEMTEGKKDLGAASRALAKATAGHNWKDSDAYAPVLAEFLDEGRRAAFAFVDVPGVVAPTLIEAKSVDDLRDPKALTDLTELPASFSSGELISFIAASSRGPARVCRGSEAGPIRCTPASAAGLPPEASGVPALLDVEDGAPPLLAFGRRRRVMDGQGLSSGVFRGGDGFRLVPANEFYVAGGWSSKTAQSVLLKDGKKWDGFTFKLTTVEGEKVRSEDAELANWNEDPRGLAVMGSRIYWATTDGEIRVRRQGAPKKDKGQTLFKLPGEVDWMRGCSIGTSHVLIVGTAAAGLPRIILSFDDQTTPAVVGGGNVSCGAEAVHVFSGDTVAVCKATGCQPETLPESTAVVRARAGDSAIIAADLSDSLLTVRTSKGDKVLGETVYDGRFAGGKVTKEAAIRDVRVIPTRRGAVVAVNISGTTSFLGVTEAGKLERLTIEQ
jgi:hypothetical protein